MKSGSQLQEEVEKLLSRTNSLLSNRSSTHGSIRGNSEVPYNSLDRPDANVMPLHSAPSPNLKAQSPSRSSNFSPRLSRMSVPGLPELTIPESPRSTRHSSPSSSPVAPFFAPKQPTSPASLQGGTVVASLRRMLSRSVVSPRGLPSSISPHSISPSSRTASVRRSLSPAVFAAGTRATIDNTRTPSFSSTVFSTGDGRGNDRLVDMSSSSQRMVSSPSRRLISAVVRKEFAELPEVRRFKTHAESFRGPPAEISSMEMQLDTAASDLVKKLSSSWGQVEIEARDKFQRLLSSGLQLAFLHAEPLLPDKVQAAVTLIKNEGHFGSYKSSPLAKASEKGDDYGLLSPSSSSPQRGSQATPALHHIEAPSFRLSPSIPHAGGSASPIVPPGFNRRSLHAENASIGDSSMEQRSKSLSQQEVMGVISDLHAALEKYQQSGSPSSPLDTRKKVSMLPGEPRQLMNEAPAWQSRRLSWRPMLDKTAVDMPPAVSLPSGSVKAADVGHWHEHRTPSWREARPVSSWLRP
ncbi:hypothetical protein CEUSTIGMA_g3690.t1 [Chlamydomonas eustigma]|uniref:Uncharacterized protein n=1 Tax=Chlamydomonas eustigma TaxID=1157962 RepID=A0A250WZN7_9CHLO|nr:hypothetical protein CEUSTIGMA_g3690.t1 [Chlamydomonas eustigma]|eukprot:GAX76246.1 hypothetical protein CEUSTIGMA_g3690.t1 [Chlamydomonas eustigma]